MREGCIVFNPQFVLYSCLTIPSQLHSLLFPKIDHKVQGKGQFKVVTPSIGRSYYGYMFLVTTKFMFRISPFNKYATKDAYWKSKSINPKSGLEKKCHIYQNQYKTTSKIREIIIIVLESILPTIKQFFHL